MPRTRDEESEVTRRGILAAAEHLLARRGEEGLSIREVCRRAGVTAPTVYHHFGDKAALVDRVVDDRFAEFDRSFQGPARPADPVEALHWMFRRYVEYGVAHPAHYRLIFQRAHLRATPAGAAAYERLRGSMAAVEAAGRLRVSVEEATAVCWSASHGLTSLILAGYYPVDTPALAILCEAVIGRIVAPGASHSHPARGPRIDADISRAGTPARGAGTRRAGRGAPSAPRPRR